MANSRSALKRILINNRNRLENRFYKSSVKTTTKLFLKQVKNYQTSKENDDKLKAQKTLNLVYSLIDKGCKKNVFHKNTGARKKSKLALQLKTVYLP